MKLGSFVAATIGALAITTSAEAATIKFSAELSPDNEVPVTPGGPGPVLGDNAPEGELEVIFDDANGKLCGVFKWRDMTGAPTAIHIHLGKEGVNSPEKLVLPVPANAANEGEFKFNVTLNAQYKTALVSKEIYGNLHSAKNKDGELRGTLFEFDGFEDPTCPEPTVLGGTPATDGGTTAGDGGGAASGSSTSSSSSSGDPAPVTTPEPEAPAAPKKPDAGAAPAAKDEGGCSTASGAANASWLVAFGALGILAIRSRRRKR